MKFEVVVIPVADVDRLKKFYTTLGWRLDADVAATRIDRVARGIDVSEMFHPGTPGAQFQLDGSGRISGPAPEHAAYRYAACIVAHQEGETPEEGAKNARPHIEGPA